MGRVEFSGELNTPLLSLFGGENKQYERFLAALTIMHIGTNVGIGGGTVREAVGITKKDLSWWAKAMNAARVAIVWSKNTSFSADEDLIQRVGYRFDGVDLDFCCAPTLHSSGLEIVAQAMSQCEIEYSCHLASNGVPIIEITGTGGKASFVCESNARHNSIFPRVGKLKAAVSITNGYVEFNGQDDDSIQGNLGENAFKVDGLGQMKPEQMEMYAAAIVRGLLYLKTLRFPSGPRPPQILEPEELKNLKDVMRGIYAGDFFHNRSISRDWFLLLDFLK